MQTYLHYTYSRSNTERTQLCSEMHNECGAITTGGFFTMIYSAFLCFSFPPYLLFLATAQNIYLTTSFISTSIWSMKSIRLLHILSRRRGRRVLLHALPSSASLSAYEFANSCMGVGSDGLPMVDYFSSLVYGPSKLQILSCDGAEMWKEQFKEQKWCGHFYQLKCFYRYMGYTYIQECLT